MAQQQFKEFGRDESPGDLRSSGSSFNVSVGLATRTEDWPRFPLARDRGDVLPTGSALRVLGGTTLPGLYGRGRRAMSRAETLKSTSACLFGKLLTPGFKVRHLESALASQNRRTPFMASIHHIQPRHSSRLTPAERQISDLEDRVAAAERERDTAILRAERAESVVRSVIRETPRHFDVCARFASEVRAS